MDSKKSFTLIELLVVIAIIGILSSLVIARFSDWGDNARIANTLQWSAGVHRTLGANLVGHWPLDQDFSDISGYNNIATCTSCPILTNGPGGHVGGFEYDGISNILDLDHDISLPFNFNSDDSFTMMIWVKVLNYPDPGGISTRASGVFLKGQTVSGAYGIQTSCSNVVEGVFTEIEFRGGVRKDVNNDVRCPVDLDEWYHLSFVHKKDGENQRLELYKNGILCHGHSFSNVADISNVLPLTIGGNRIIGGNASYLNAILSDARIYNVDLVAEEVSRIYAETKDSYLVYE